MNNSEFSSTFDTLLNSHNTSKDFGETNNFVSIELDEYEKSVLLTQAQDIIIKEYFNAGRTAEGFDDSPRRQMDFSRLITVGKGIKIEDKNTDTVKYDDRSILYKIPTDILIILQEKLIVKENNASINNTHIVVPIRYEEYDRLMQKAYAQPLKKQAWRLLQNNVISYAEIIPRNHTKIEEYKLRYLRKPAPIILVDLASGEYGEELNINGVTTISECELHPIIHMDILLKAVELAFNRRSLTTPQPSNNRQ